jgi:hypothetical protein
MTKFGHIKNQIREKSHFHLLFYYSPFPFEFFPLLE